MKALLVHIAWFDAYQLIQTLKRKETKCHISSLTEGSSYQSTAKSLLGLAEDGNMRHSMSQKLASNEHSASICKEERLALRTNALETTPVREFNAARPCPNAIALSMKASLAHQELEEGFSLEPCRLCYYLYTGYVSCPNVIRLEDVPTFYCFSRVRSVFHMMNK